VSELGIAPTAKPSVSLIRRLAARRQLRDAAQLLKRGAVNRVDFAVLAVDAVARLTGRSLRRPEGWDVIGFPIEAGFAVGARPDSLDPSQWREYGPFEHAVAWIGEAFPTSEGGGDQYNIQTLTFTWGDNADQLLRRARLRRRLSTRLLERVDEWRGEQAELAPHLHDDLWKLVWAVLCAILGFALGRFTAP
jgi:hypothetical protein